MEHVPSPTSAVLAGLLQHRLDHHPDGILDVFPLRTGGLGFINYRDFGLGCRRFIRAICPQAPVTRGTVVGLILQCDTLMYQTAICGLIRAGLTVSVLSLSPSYGLNVRDPSHQVFPISPRFPPGTICDLLQSVSVCRVLITSTASESLLNDMRAEMDKRQYNITFENLPSFEDIFPEIFGLVDRDSNELDAVPLPTADAYPDGVELWLHSSGSTGQPKPLPLTHAFIHKMQFSRMSKFVLLCSRYLSNDSRKFRLAHATRHPHRQVADFPYQPGYSCFA
jgi:acyl-CoA synthetase (AMP-forming)/AMP-acid ligase II